MLNRKHLKNRYVRIGLVTIVLLAMVALIAWVLWANTAIEINTFKITSDKLPEAFDGYRIAQVSDLHNAEFGEENEELIKLLQETRPDIIVVTGDLVDSRNTNVEIALNFAKQAIQIAPCYYVTGNHEARLSKEEYKKLEDGLLEVGVQVLHGEEVFLQKEDSVITLLGVDDPSFCTIDDEVIKMQVTAQQIRELSSIENYTILLSHRPELFQEYCDAGVDLVFSGHAHGGQFRLPFIGGLIAPNQGLFPKYDSGLYQQENTNMIVSRGLGNSLCPIRFNNRPEIVVVELQSVSKSNN